jgi:hypothetical protein
MSFQWNPHFPPEREAAEPLPLWFFLLMYVVIEVTALFIVVPDLPKGSFPWDKFFHDAVAVPFVCWFGLSCLMHMGAYDVPATLAADHNTERWNDIASWQQQSCAGMAVLDSVIVTPEPDLAERMLRLEGDPPDNPGKVMALGSIEAAEGRSRLHALLEALLTPLAPRLTQAAKSGSFEIVMQCDDTELSSEVKAVWSKVGLPGKPVVRWVGHARDLGFAEDWFRDTRYPAWYNLDATPKCRLVLSWHLNAEHPDVEPTDSEAAVALLLASPAFMHEEPKLKYQAWLLRQITGDADQVDKSLAWLLKAEQVPAGRIHHFWHARLKGLAQHATLGAVRESGLKVEGHAIEPAIGPQAPVVRWVLQALAAKMAHFGQGAQLVALPHEQGVALNVVAKERAGVTVPWKHEYDYDPILGPEQGAFASLWVLAMLITPKGWSTADTTLSCVVAVAMVVFFLFRHPGPVRYVAHLIDYYW